jgi:hypothetical protein
MTMHSKGVSHITRIDICFFLKSMLVCPILSLSGNGKKENKVIENQM